MGDVAIKYRLLPESPDQNIESVIEAIMKSLPSGVKVHKTDIRPFAFGLKAIEMLIVMKDAGGLSEQTETTLQQVQGIQSVEVLEMSLI